MANKQNEPNVEAPANDDQTSTRFETKKVYLKDASFEAPSSPNVFTKQNAPPTINIEAAISYGIIENNPGIYNVNLKITVTAKHDDSILYLAEVQQAGIFQIQHPDTKTHELVCEITCPNILLPFAREELNNLITKGGFNAFLLVPINFESLYRAKQEKEKKHASNADETGMPN